MELRGRSSSRSTSRTGTGTTTVSRERKEGGEFFAGLVCIWIALPMVWMNERKNVKIYQTILKGEEALIEADAFKPEPEKKSELVHMQGRTSTFEPVGDALFGLLYGDTIKVKRSVEVFQWVQKEKKEKDGDEERTTYYYEKEWTSSYHDQGSFVSPEHCDGPANPR